MPLLPIALARATQLGLEDHFQSGTPGWCVGAGCHAGACWSPSSSYMGLPGDYLGLSVVKKIVDEHGGKISLTNLDDEGACITLRFILENNNLCEVPTS